MTTNTDVAMPELPPMQARLDTGGGWMAVANGYTADQMREYARAAIQQAAGAVPEGALIERIATHWDGCMYDCHAVGEVDIGAAIRQNAKHFATSMAPPKQQPVHLGGGEVGGVPQPLILPPLDDDLAFILGTMCFQCITYAQMLRASGQKIETRAEAEQAAVIHWLLGFYFQHGAAWRNAAIKEAERLRAEFVNTKSCQINQETKNG